MNSSRSTLALATLLALSGPAFAIPVRESKPKDSEDKNKKLFDEAGPCALPRTAKEKYAAMGLSTTTPAEQEAIRGDYGMRPNNNALIPSSRECQRRLRQIQRRKQVATSSPSSPEEK